MYRKSDSLLEVDLILDSSVGRARVDRWQRAWGRCACLWAVACYVVTPTQPRRQKPTRARPTEASRFNQPSVPA